MKWRSVARTAIRLFKRYEMPSVQQLKLLLITAIDGNF
jgi:hypothetical protein